MRRPAAAGATITRPEPVAPPAFLSTGVEAGAKRTAVAPGVSSLDAFEAFGLFVKRFAEDPADMRSCERLPSLVTRVATAPDEQVTDVKAWHAWLACVRDVLAHRQGGAGHPPLRSAVSPVQAFLAMGSYLDEFYRETGDFGLPEQLPTLIVELSISWDGAPLDRASWDDWRRHLAEAAEDPRVSTILA